MKPEQYGHAKCELLVTELISPVSLESADMRPPTPIIATHHSSHLTIDLLGYYICIVSLNDNRF